MENDVTSQENTPTEETFDRDALEASVSKGLEAMVASDEDSLELTPLEEEPVAAEPAEKEPLAAEPTEAEPVAAEPIEGEPTEEEPTGEASEGESTEEQPPEPKEDLAPTFPGAWRRTLRAYDWTDDEIEDALSQEPNARASFMATAQKLHANRNAELAKWAEMGRRERNANPAEEKVLPVSDTETGKFPLTNIDGLIEKHGNEDLVREIAGPFDKMLAEINAIMPDLVSGVQSIRESRKQVLTGQIERFFGSEDLKPYAEVYGAGSDSLSEDQEGTRNKVLEFADALVAGASLQGRKLSTDEALMLAHDSVSGGFKEKAIRTEIRKSVTVRSKGLSLKPTGVVTPKTGPKTREQLEKDVKGRLAAVFGS